MKRSGDINLQVVPGQRYEVRESYSMAGVKQINICVLRKIEVTFGSGKKKEKSPGVHTTNIAYIQNILRNNKVSLI